MAEQARRDARQDASGLVQEFVEKFGALSCRDLLGFDSADSEAGRKFRETEGWKEKCGQYVEFVIEKMYELDKG